MPERYDEVVSHYERAREGARLNEGVGLLEWTRTLELLERFLPRPPARLLDAGAGPGAYACWLARMGHEVHVLDLVPGHVEEARRRSDGQPEHPCASFAVGDARELDFPDEHFDAVLLLGPLYHLVERAERVQALAEARRVTRPGGPVLVACISRYASVLDGLRLGVLHDPDFRDMVRQDLSEGRHVNPTDSPELFTTAWFHEPAEIPEELAEAGLEWRQTLGIEGAGWLLTDFEERWGSEEGREEILFAARELERRPSVLGVSAHLLAVAARPG